MQDWFIPYLHQNYGRGFRGLKPYGFVVMDVPMLYNPAPYSQSIIAPEGWGLEAKVYFLFRMNKRRGIATEKPIKLKDSKQENITKTRLFKYIKNFTTKN